ncbi:unnamed protein product [Trichogramma brassicae]|uniref:Uncharacterized protein n=1 Tax=Trichogramma brassicae TaxID=86971 RepID=A0A6H5HX44_9HYME|nr:unnamed protein product [Trichogramma brassicae]
MCPSKKAADINHDGTGQRRGVDLDEERKNLRFRILLQHLQQQPIPHQRIFSEILTIVDYISLSIYINCYTPAIIMSDQLVRRQNELKDKLTKSYGNFAKLGQKQMTEGANEVRLARHREWWEEFERNHEELVNSVDYDPNIPYFKEGCYNITEEAYMVSLGSYLDLQKYYEGLKPRSQVVGPPAPMSRLSLKPIEPPTFSGEYGDWEEFRNFSHSENFDVAWNALKSEYDNKRRLVASQVAAIRLLAPAQEETSVELRRVLMGVRYPLARLAALKRPVKYWGDVLVDVLLSRLDQNTIREWETHLSSGGNHLTPSTYEDLDGFVEKKICALQSIEATMPRDDNKASSNMSSESPSSSNIKRPSYNNKQKHRVKSTTSSSLVNTASNNNAKRKPACYLCKGDHLIMMCDVFRRMTVDRRRAAVRENNLCYNCLGKHSSEECKSSRRCMECLQAHHTLLHQPSASTNAPASPRPQTVERSSAVSRELTSVTACAADAPARATILLATALVRVIGPTGRCVLARAMIDQCSQASYITANLQRKLKLETESVSHISLGLDDATQARSDKMARLTVAPHFDSQFRLECGAYVVKSVTNYLPRLSSANQKWTHLEGLQLADPEYYQGRTVELLLSSAMHARIVEGRVEKGAANEPIATLTAFGWILSGDTGEQTASNEAAAFVITDQCCDTRVLNESIRRFWHIEEISSKPLLTPEEDECEKHFASTHERDAAGRYVIRLPLKRELSSTSVDLGDSRAAAKRSLYHMERRFRRDDALHAAYADFMAEYQSMNHMELVSEEELPKNAVYLPHHGVWKEGKLRVVFNASCVTSKGLSLNSLLHTGANLLPDLSHLLLRWRTYKYVFSTDIQKMFRQILVHENDRHLQCILWRKHDTEPIATYRLTTVTYGMGSAPFLAIRSLRQLARDEGEEYPLAASVLQQEVYMDDGLSGGHSVKEAREKRDQLIRMLRVGGFKLHKWAANDEALIDDIPADQRASTVARSFDVAEAVGVLGLMWSPTEDSFLYKLQLDRIEGAITKRKILSKIAQVFDPLGWISPVTIVGKLLIQQLWLKGIDWDVELPEDLRSFWTMWYSSLEGLAKVRIDRWTGYVPDAARIELHGRRAKWHPRIRSPCLDWNYAVRYCLLARLMQSVMSELHIEPDKINLWTDSTDVIYWLQAHPSRWQTFVANRCSTIHTLLPDVGWHHVRSADNPADILSRGTTVEELLTSDLWWRGPPWLSLDTAEWPPVALSLPPRVREERKAAAVVLANNERDQEDPGVAGKFSSMLRLLRGTVICFRFLRALLVRVRRRSEVLDWIRRMPLERSSSLSTEEMCHVRMFWISWAQRREFAAERRAVGDNVSVRPSSRLASLHPIFVEGILRVGGRLKHSLLDFDEAHPIILPSDSPITALLIRGT